MDGWIVACNLYLIPVLAGMISGKAKDLREPHLWEIILWPPLMLMGAIILWFQARKRR